MLLKFFEVKNDTPSQSVKISKLPSARVTVISDRTFLVKSIKIIKANAVLDGRSEANLEDLKALKYILAFRVPEEVLKMAEEKLESLQAQKKKTKK